MTMIDHRVYNTPPTDPALKVVRKNDNSYNRYYDSSSLFNYRCNGVQQFKK